MVKPINTTNLKVQVHSISSILIKHLILNQHKLLPVNV